MKQTLEEADSGDSGEESLYDIYKKTTPLFASREEARAVYLQKLEAIALAHGKSVAALIEDADYGPWNEENREILRLERLVQSLGGYSKLEG